MKNYNCAGDKTSPQGHNALGFVEETVERSVKSVGIQSIHDKRIWRVKDVAKFLGCSEGYVYRLASDEKIPKIKKGKFVYFMPERIHNWVLEGDLK